MHLWEVSDFIKNLVHKSIETSYFLKNFINYERKFDFQKLSENQIKIKVILMVYCKLLVNL